MLWQKEMSIHSEVFPTHPLNAIDVFDTNKIKRPHFGCECYNKITNSVSNASVVYINLHHFFHSFNTF